MVRKQIFLLQEHPLTPIIRKDTTSNVVAGALDNSLFQLFFRGLRHTWKSIYQILFHTSTGIRASSKTASALGDSCIDALQKL
jgi:hypothetical protein